MRSKFAVHQFHWISYLFSFLTPYFFLGGWLGLHFLVCHCLSINWVKLGETRKEIWNIFTWKHQNFFTLVLSPFIESEVLFNEALIIKALRVNYVVIIRLVDLMLKVSFDNLRGNGPIRNEINEVLHINNHFVETVNVNRHPKVY